MIAIEVVTELTSTFDILLMKTNGVLTLGSRNSEVIELYLIKSELKSV